MSLNESEIGSNLGKRHSIHSRKFTNIGELWCLQYDSTFSSNPRVTCPVPNSVREFLDRIGIEYTEIHVAEFRRVAERRGFSIRSETQAAIVENRSSSSIFPGRDSTGVKPRHLRSVLGLVVPTGEVVTHASKLRWRAYGMDLALENCAEFDPAEFRDLVSAFQEAVSSKRNARIVEDLMNFGANPCSSHWPHSSNSSLLRWVTTSSYKEAVPCAFSIWKYMFGEPAPTWYVWHQKRYIFDPEAWKVWFESLRKKE